MKRSLVALWLASLTALGCDEEDQKKAAPDKDASVERDAGREPRDAALDARVPDAETPSCRPFSAPTDCVIPTDGTLPEDLRCTGLYGDWDTRQIACDVVLYEPAYPLWTDGAVKKRWVSLPKGATIDVTNPDEPVYPEGTMFFKEFDILDGQGGTRLGETRVLRKINATDWVYGTYVWNEDGSSALQQVDGVENLFGLGHTVPTRDQCAECHKGRQDYVLGWDLLLLGKGATGVTLESLVAQGTLVSRAGPITALVIPGNEVEQAALGYMHTNCGVSCHNRNDGAKGKQSSLFLRLDAAKLGSVAQTDAFLAIHKTPSSNAPTTPMAPASGAFFDIRPLDPERSLLLARMKVRGNKGQMPAIGTNVIDEAGVKIVSDWILGMTEAAGYPAPLP